MTRIAARSIRILAGLVLAAAPCTGQQPAGRVAWRFVAAGSGHTCGLTTDSVAYCWGENDWGQLGDGTRRGKYVPVAVAVRAGLRFRSLGVGGTNACAVATDGSMWCWGDNRNGELDRTRWTRATPVRVAPRLRFRSVSMGDLTCGVAESGTTYCWGLRHVAPVAVADAERARSDASGIRRCVADSDTTGICWEGQDSVPAPLQVPAGLRVARLFPGDPDCAITAEGEAWCWGAYVPGRLENHLPRERWMEPSRVAPGLRLRSIHTGWRLACGLTLDGVPYCWGEGHPLLPGVPESETALVPVRVPVERPLVSLTFGERHACGLTAEGLAYCWGANATGSLGDGTDSARVGAVRVSDPATPGATDIAGAPEPVRRVRTRPSTLVIPRDYDPSRRYPVVVRFPATGSSVADGTGGVVRSEAAMEHLELLTGDQGSEDDYITGEAWWETVLRYERGVLEDLSSFAAQYGLDTTRVVGEGFSLGGDLAWALSQRNPAKFIGAVVVGSRAGYRATPGALATMARRRARFYFALSVGEDSVRIAGAEAAMELLRRNGVEFRYGRIPGAGHARATGTMLEEALAFILEPR